MNWNIFLLILLLAGAAVAADEVPLETRYRTSPRRAMFARMDKAYQDRLKQRQDYVAAQHEKVVAMMNVPPWMRTEAMGGSSLDENSGRTTVIAVPEKIQKRNHRFLISVVLLILLGAVAGWVRHATKEIDE